MSDELIISIRNLTKKYRHSEQNALNGISLDINRKSIFGLLGPNGAGKTTTISILCGLIPRTSGELSIDGLNPDSSLDRIRGIIGIAPQEIALYPSLTARENLEFIGKMYGLRKDRLRSRIEECLVMMGLEQKADRLIKTYSGGMKRRVNLIAGILHRPAILFLDEPTVGIDVQSRNLIMQHIKVLNDSGTTVIYTSHYLEEAESLCDEIAIIDEGRILLQGRVKDIIASSPEYHNLESVFLHLTGRKLRDN